MMGPVRPISYVVLVPGPEARNQEHGRTRRLNQSFERQGLLLRLWHGSDSNVVLMPCRTKFINFWDVFSEMHMHILCFIDCWLDTTFTMIKFDSGTTSELMSRFCRTSFKPSEWQLDPIRHSRSTPYEWASVSKSSQFYMFFFYN